MKHINQTLSCISNDSAGALCSVHVAQHGLWCLFTTCHVTLHELPVVTLRILYLPVERTYQRVVTASTACVPESHSPSHSVIDIIVVRFSINHELHVCYLIYY